MRLSPSVNTILFSAILIPFFWNCKKEAVKTSPAIPVSAISNITSNSATSGGELISDGGSGITAKGICWDTIQTPTITDKKISGGSGTDSFASSLTDLKPGKKYYVRAYAINALGTTYSSEVSFSTTIVAPTLSTIAVKDSTNTLVVGCGNITSDGGSKVTARGLCWSTTQNPTTGSAKATDREVGSGVYNCNITGLNVGTTYYIRAYATNGISTSYGNEIIFTPGTVTDIDGNVYHCIVLGAQTWLVENLKTTKFRNGDPIPNITDNAAWGTMATGAYSWYNNDVTNKASYGALYNWSAVADDTIKIITPAGWHVATDSDWNTLTTYLGGDSIAGGLLKEAGTAHWQTPNKGTAKRSGFNALPGGYRYYVDGTFGGVGLNGAWWTKPDRKANYGWYRFLVSNFDDSYRYGTTGKAGGFYVRCVRN